MIVFFVLFFCYGPTAVRSVQFMCFDFRLHRIYFVD